MLVCVLSLLLGFYVLSVRRSAALTVFFFVTALHTVLRIADDNFFDNAFAGLTLPLSFLYVPLIFLAVRELLFDTQRRWWPHLLPAAAALIAKLIGIKNPLLYGVAIAIIHIVYLWASFALAFNYRRISNTIRSSNPEGIIWLLRGLAVYTLMVSYQMLRYIIDPLVIEENSPLHLLFHGATSLIFAGIILQIMRAPGLLKTLDADDIALEQAINQTAAPLATAVTETAEEKSATDNAELRQVMQRIDALMKEQKPFREPELSLNDMAEKLQLPPRQVSQAINSLHQTNFPDFINRARVDEAKRLMESNEWSRRSLLDIGLEAGFNSKSSFNLMFKRIANITPSAYRRMLRDGEQHTT